MNDLIQHEISPLSGSPADLYVQTGTKGMRDRAAGLGAFNERTGIAAPCQLAHNGHFGSLCDNGITFKVNCHRHMQVRYLHAHVMRRVLHVITETTAQSEREQLTAVKA
jgi:hypothetical protein